MLDLRFAHRRAVFPKQGKRAGCLGPKRHAFDQRPQFRDRRPRATCHLVQSPQPEVTAFDGLGKRNHVFRRGLGKLAHDDRFAHLLAVVADVAFVLAYRPIPAAGTRQVREAGYLVRGPQIDQNLMRMARLAELPVGMPHGGGITVHGAVSFVARILAIDPHLDLYGFRLRPNRSAQQQQTHACPYPNRSCHLKHSDLLDC